MRSDCQLLPCPKDMLCKKCDTREGCEILKCFNKRKCSSCCHIHIKALIVYIGTCSICGGNVGVPVSSWDQSDIKCNGCGAVSDSRRKATILMLEATKEFNTNCHCANQVPTPTGHCMSCGYII